MALDVGTTTLAAYLFDLTSGRQLGSAASRNPQRRFGADVITRIAHVRRESREGLGELHTAVIEGLNTLLGQLSEKAGISPDRIYEAKVVGNPTMIHLFLGIDPRGIDVSPYAPVVGQRVLCRAGDVGLAMHPCGVVETLPAISAYVGADIVAGILATDIQRSEANTLFLDVGTNGEMVLALGNRLIACSTAAGPAFEGASIVQGMAALDGAIETVRVHGGRIDCSVIGGAVPTGLCGTGLLSAVAELLSAGLIDRTGRFSDAGSRLADRLDGEGKDRRVRLTDGAEPVYLYQQDVREFQLAKAAVRSGIEVLLQYAGLRAEDLARVLIGGAFSTRLSPAHLMETGFLPRVDVARIHVVGNTAGQGAKQALLNQQMMGRVDEIARSVVYIELSSDQDFNESFVEQIPFPAAG
ncbi:ASKHA domain-containing protein [Candidatus Bipolaricaulota bacterium]